MLTPAQTIAIYQPTLQSIAYNLLGSIADAEDAVHDAFVKWLTIDASKIENTKAYLVKMVTNACINILKSKKQALDVHTLDSILLDEEREKALFHFDLEQQVAEAWGFLHKKLEPLERAVFVLREVFNVDYEDVQDIVGKKADNCRKIFSRAKHKLKNAELPKVPVAIADLHFFENFKSVCKTGQLTQLFHGLSSDLFAKKR